MVSIVRKAGEVQHCADFAVIGDDSIQSGEPNGRAAAAVQIEHDVQSSQQHLLIGMVVVPQKVIGVVEGGCEAFVVNHCPFMLTGNVPGH